MPKAALETTFKPIRYDFASLRERGIGRARSLPGIFKVEAEAFRGKRVIELGCGGGETTAAVISEFGAEAIGVDLSDRFERGPFREMTCFRRLDIARKGVRALGKFDYVISFDCLEHVEQPFDALRNVKELLAPGGRAFLRFNLYRGASASHLMGFLNEPWIHLLETPEQIRERMLAKHGRDVGPAWVNKLTHHHYLEYFRRLGFESRHWFRMHRMSDDFYQQHREKLRAYPREDLDRNFMNAILWLPEGVQDESHG